MKYILAVVALATVVTASPCLAAEHTAKEAANIALVHRMLNELERDSPSSASVAAFFSDDCYIRWSEKDTPAQGKEAALKKLATLFPPNTKYRIVIHQTFAKGPVVMNSRDDIQITAGKEAHPFHVVGLFVVKDGKITTWSDYEDK
jgi:limonene-1,2-epoxide hydrolase